MCSTNWGRWKIEDGKKRKDNQEFRSSAGLRNDGSHRKMGIRRVPERQWPNSMDFGSGAEEKRAIEKIKKTPLFQKNRGVSVVVLPGFEPRLTEPKPGVLPLHHRTILMCFVKSSAKV